MLFMDDAIRATIELMEAPSEQIKIRSSYNLAGVSFTPKELSEAIKKQLPDFKITYNPDFRQAIADSWPNSIDDAITEQDWGWKARFNLPKIVDEMIKNIKK
jgi:nucleoside-diphosphate-sugar epimerase